jgi:nucleoside-diphosphate-sugar epimerase
MKKVLIIGGCGYVGSALYEYLTSKNTVKYSFPLTYDSKYDVTTVDLEWWGNNVNPNNIVMDYRHLTAEQLAKYDVVILLAAHSSPAMAMSGDKQSTFNNNVRNFIELLPKLHSKQKFIYAGSSAVYNKIPDDNVTEEYNFLNPVNIYDFSKQDLSRLMELHPDIEYYELRFATVNGASPNLRTDIMVNSMVDSVKTTGQVKLFNEETRRPILYLKDLCRAVETIIECEEDHRGVYNLASVNGTAGSIAETVAFTLNAHLMRVSQQQAERAVNAKLAAYDFSISTKKFEEIFNFKFMGTIEAIAEEVAAQYNNMLKEKRVKGIHYV